MIKIEQNTRDALTVIAEASEWLLGKEMLPWDPNDFKSGKIVIQVDKTAFCIRHKETAHHVRQK